VGVDTGADSELRRSPRKRKADYDRYAFHISVKRALRTRGKHAFDKIVDEVAQMLSKGVWRPAHADETDGQIIRSSMFLKEKFSPGGDFEKLKARLVAHGNLQDRTLYDDVSSPTVQTNHILAILNILSAELRHARVFDIGGAYLNASLKKKVFMILDPFLSSVVVTLEPSYESFLDPVTKTMKVQLLKALYGCIESGKEWYEEAAKFLTLLGFVRNPLDDCVFNKGEGGEQLTVLLHVDDFLATCIDEMKLDQLEAQLLERFVEVKTQKGDSLSYVGLNISIKRTPTAVSVVVTMEKTVGDILTKSEVQGVANSPAAASLFDINEATPLLSETARKRFHRLVAMALYLTKRVRPDVMLAVSFLTTRVTCATTEDEAKLTRLLKYLNGTRELGLVLSGVMPLQVELYADASFAVHPDRKSHSADLLLLGGGFVAARSYKQKIVTRSSAEAEFVCCSDSVSVGLGLRNFLIQQGHEIPPVVLYQDNTSSAFLAAKGKPASDRTRHVDIRYFFVFDCVARGELRIEYMPTERMRADMLTKPLQGSLFAEPRDQLLNWF
jgi:histone deacetylase 1/2